MGDYPTPGGRNNHPAEIWYASGGNTVGQASKTTVRGAAFSLSAAGPLSIGFSNSQFLLSLNSSLTNINVSAGATSLNLSAVTFSNLNGVSFGLAASVITASVNTSYLASNASTNYVQANANFNGTNASGTIASNAISVSVAAQSVQPAVNALGVSNTGNTAGNTGTSSGITFAIAGSNNITASQSTAGGGPNTIWLSGPTLTQYLTTAALSGDTTKYIENWNLTGNTAGTTSSAQGNNLWLGGGNGVTISGSSNTISFSVATSYLASNASSNYMQNWKLTGNTAGTTSSAEGTDLWFGGGNGVTLSGSSNTISISVATSYLASNASTNYVQANAVFNGTNASGTIASNAISVSVSAPMGFGASNTGNTAGNTGTSGGITWVIAGTSNITVSESTTAGGPNTLWLSAPNVAAGNVTFSAAGSSNALGSVVFSNSNGVTFGLTGSTITASVNAGGGASMGVSNTGNTLGNTGTSSGIAFVFAGSGAITASQSTTAGGPNTIWYSVPATSSISASGWAQVSTNGSTISIGATTTANIYGVGNTSGTSSGTADIRTISISGGPGIVVAASNSGWNIAEQYMSFYEPYPLFGGGGASSSQGLSTLHVFPFVPPACVSFNQLNLIASASLVTTTAPNTLTVTNNTVGGANVSFNFQVTFSFSNSQFIDLFLFSKGSGGFSTNLFTVASTRNSVVTFATHTYNASLSSVSLSIKSSISEVISYPALTSGTQTSINAASTVTTWAPGYDSFTASTSTSNSTSSNPGTTWSLSCPGTFVATTLISSSKMFAMNFATSISGGEWWLGIRVGSSTSSGSSTANTNANASASYTFANSASVLTASGNLSSLGQTVTISNSLGYLSGNSASTLGPYQVQGSFSATYDPGTTYVNNAGQPNGAIAMSNVKTNVSNWRPWFQLCSNRL